MTQKNLTLLAALFALSAAPASAQTGKPNSCKLAQELEIDFELQLPDGHIAALAYAGCSEADRNDYQPPYTERDYYSENGYHVMIVTQEGWSGPGGSSYDGTTSEVLIGRNRRWIGRSAGELANAKIASGEAIAMTIQQDDGPATVRLRAVKAMDELRGCEAAFQKANPGYGKPVFRGGDDRPFLGYEIARYGEGSTVAASLVLLTDTAAYYYSEPCDICADVDKCDLKTRTISNALHAHSLDCRDMAPLTKGSVAFDACAAQ